MDVPLQSMSPRILKLMNRCYDIPAVLKIVRAIRLINPVMCVRTHIIYCFPSETRREFELSFNLTEYFNEVSYFCYADKRNTAASFLPSKNKINVFEKMWRTSLIIRKKEANINRQVVVIGGYAESNINEVFTSIKKYNPHENAEVLLIYPKSGDDLNIGHPLSSLRVAGLLLKKGLSVRIIDERLENKKTFLEKLEESLGFNKLACIGLSSYTASQLKSSIRIVKYIKSKSNVPVVLWGEHARIRPDKILRLRGDEEASFPGLVESIKGSILAPGIKGVSYKSKNRKIVHNPGHAPVAMSKSERLPYYILDDYLQKYNRAFIQISRRCPVNERTRFIPLEDVIGELKNLQGFYQGHFIVFVDENYFINLKMVASLNSLLLEEIKGGRIKPFEWCAQGNAGDILRVSPKLMRLLINSGLRSICVRGGGAETVIKATKFLRNFNINVEHTLAF
jgi:hypothetical protein